MSSFKGRTVKNKSKTRKEAKEFIKLANIEGSPIKELFEGEKSNKDLDNTMEEFLKQQTK